MAILCLPISLLYCLRLFSNWIERIQSFFLVSDFMSLYWIYSNLIESQTLRIESFPSKVNVQSFKFNDLAIDYIFNNFALNLGLSFELEVLNAIQVVHINDSFQFESTSISYKGMLVVTFKLKTAINVDDLYGIQHFQFESPRFRAKLLKI